MKKATKGFSFPGCYFFFLLFVLHLCGIYLFSRGFFLTRYEIPTLSTCDDAKTAFPDLPNLSGELENQHFCWSPPSLKKVVIILIDALRFEYTLYNESETNPQPNQNKLPILQQLMKEEPEKTFLFRFRADPPTATMQRLKGILTGGLPTFIDIGENFASGQIREDNLVEQLLRQGYRITFIGDDTWEALFPQKFTKSYPYPSFNVKDITNGDIFTVSYLIPEITSKEPWDIIISHFLGVDHVGHRFDSNHPIMGDKLLQMNEIIGQVVQTIDEDTLFVLMGDHGSTADGNHGGATPEEVNSALFLYSKKPLKNSIAFHPYYSSQTRKFGNSLQSRTDFPTVSQIDLVPTLSLLMGVPIPFSNIGGLIGDVLLRTDIPENGIEELWKDEFDGSFHPKNIAKNTSDYQEKLIDSMTKTNIGLMLNSWQIFRYLKDYSTLSSEFPASLITKMGQDLDSLNQKLDQLIKSRSSSTEIHKLWLQHVEIYNSYKKFHSQVGEICRDLWVAFDLVSMTLGIVILGLALLIVGLYLVCDVPFFNRNFASLLMFLFIGNSFTFGVSNMFEFSFHWIALGTLGSALGIVVLLILPLRFHPRYSISDYVTFDNFAMLFFFILHSAALFGNSYIEAENHVVRYLVVSYAIVLFVQTEMANVFLPKIVMIAALTRFSTYCTGGIYESTGNFFELFLRTMLPLLLFCVFQQLQFKQYAPHALFESIHIGLVSFMALFWTLQHFGVFHTLPFLAKFMPRIVYITCLAVIFYVIFKKKTSNVVHSIAHIQAFLYIPVILVTGLEGPLWALLLFLQSNLLVSVFPMTKRSETLNIAMVWGFLVLQYFFASGHSFDFSGVHWAAAFVGFEDVNWGLMAILMVLETWSSAVILTVALPILVLQVFNIQDTIRVVNSYFGMFLFFFQTNSFLTTVFVFFARRHLMVWRVFAPKFLFESGQLLLLDVLVMGSIGLVNRLWKSYHRKAE